MDPAHIAPSRSDANSNGHFPLNNHAPAGTPRGFNLNNMPFGVPPNMANGMPNPAAFLAFSAQYGVTPPANWGAPNPGFGDDERHQAGPIRRNNNRFINRAAGPYDRQSKDARNTRWANGGRLTPPRPGSGRPSGGPRFADGGAATVGPREAVQGRSLKSYEDLDAAGGSGTGELNY